MLRSGMANDKILLHGVRRGDQLYFSQEWKDALGNNYHPFCSREDIEGIPRGRVNRYLENETLPTDLKYYICGQATMCVEVRDVLIAKGIPFGKIVTEIYF